MSPRSRNSDDDLLWVCRSALDSRRDTHFLCLNPPKIAINSSSDDGRALYRNRLGVVESRIGREGSLVVRES